MAIDHNQYLDHLEFGQKDGHVYCALYKSYMSIFGAHLISREEAVSLLEGADHYILSQPRDNIVCISQSQAGQDKLSMPLEKAFMFAFSRLDCSPGGDSYPDIVYAKEHPTVRDRLTFGMKDGLMYCALSKEILAEFGASPVEVKAFSDYFYAHDDIRVSKVAEGVAYVQAVSGVSPDEANSSQDVIRELIRLLDD